MRLESVARQHFSKRGNNWIGEFPSDPVIGWVSGRRGIRRILCSQQTISAFSKDQAIATLNQLYHAKLHELRSNQAKEDKKKAQRIRKKMTVKQAKDIWIKEMDVTNTRKTMSMYEQSLSLYIAACGDHAVNEISREHNIIFLAFLKKAKGHGNKTMSGQTQKKHLRHLKIFLGWAYDCELIDNLIRIKSPRVIEKDMETFSMDETNWEKRS